LWFTIPFYQIPAGWTERLSPISLCILINCSLAQGRSTICPPKSFPALNIKMISVFRVRPRPIPGSAEQLRFLFIERNLLRVRHQQHFTCGHIVDVGF
jgi:hypothetical protein